MAKKDNFFDKAFDTLKDNVELTEQQKSTMLNNILSECHRQKVTGIDKIKESL